MKFHPFEKLFSAFYGLRNRKLWKAITGFFEEPTTPGGTFMYKRLKPSNDRYAQGLKVGLQPRRGADNRPILNQNGTYAFILKNGEKANLKVAIQPGQAIPKAVVSVAGNAISVPLLELARSIKVGDDGRPARIAE